MPLFRPNVKRLKKKGDVNGLIKALVYRPKWAPPSGEVKQAASVALVEIGDPAVPNIIDTLNQPDKYLRINAVKILGEICSIQAKEALIQSLEDEDCDYRLEAIKALGSFQDEKLTGHMIQALEDDNHLIRKSAAELLEKITAGGDSQRFFGLVLAFGIY